MVISDRRADHRVNLARACKLYLPAAGRYYPGSTWNVSSGGVLLELDRRAHVRPGQRLFVGIALKRRQAVLTHNEMIAAEVVRVMGTPDDRTVLAARFVEPGMEPAGTVLRAA